MSKTEIIVGIVLLSLTLATLIVQYCDGRLQEYQNTKQSKLLRLIDDQGIANYWQSHLVESRIQDISVHTGAKLSFTFDKNSPENIVYPEITQLKKDYSDGKISIDEYMNNINYFHNKKAETFGEIYNKDFQEFQDFEKKEPKIFGVKIKYIKFFFYFIEVVSLIILYFLYFIEFKGR